MRVYLETLDGHARLKLEPDTQMDRGILACCEAAHHATIVRQGGGKFVVIVLSYEAGEQLSAEVCEKMDGAKEENDGR